FHLLAFVTTSRQETKTRYGRNWKLEALARVKRHELYAIGQLVMPLRISSSHQPFDRDPGCVKSRCNMPTDESVPVNHRHVSPRHALRMKSCEAVSDVVTLGSEIRLCPQLRSRAMTVCCFRYDQRNAVFVRLLWRQHVFRELVGYLEHLCRIAVVQT